MKRLLIVGAGGFGREVLFWATDMNRARPRWETIAFLDANLQALDGYTCTAKIIGDVASYKPSPDDELVCAIGRPATKLRVCRGLSAKGATFTTIVHPTAVVSPDCKMGQGCIVGPAAFVSVNTTIGDFVAINAHSSVGHDALIGAGSTLSAHCDVTGNVVLAEGSFLGSHASVLPGASVGEFATVGAGSVVLRGVAPHSTVMGVPGKVLIGKPFGTA